MLLASLPGCQSQGGGGYYDRFLSTFPGPRIALAYAWQWSEAFTPEPHDNAVDFLVSESEAWPTSAPCT